MSDEVFVAQMQPVRMAIYAALGAGFVAASLWLVGAFGDPPDSSGFCVGWLGLIVFGPLTLVIVARFFAPRDVVRVDRQGIRFTPWSDDLIPWSAIASFSTVEVHRQKFLGLHLHHPDRHGSPRMLGRLGKANAALGWGHVNLSVNGTDRSFAELVEAVERHAARSR